MGHLDPIVQAAREGGRSRGQVKLELEQTFMFYLPRICEHCLNPSCVASCPSGAMYKRAEDGIVLVDQDRCRGWRQCVTGCPYKKVYFNHRTGKAEKCTFCYPRIEVGLPTVCSETCVGRLRYIGLVLYDADRVIEAASTPDDGDLYEAQLDVMLDPDDPEVGGAGPHGRHLRRLDGRRPPIPGLRAGQDLPDRPAAAPGVPHHADGLVRAAAVPGRRRDRRDGHDGEDRANLFGAIDALRIPVEYLAELFSAGRTAIVTGVLKKLAAMRAYMRDINLGRDRDPADPRLRRDGGGAHVRDVPADGDRQIRRPLRHPHRLRRARARARGDRAARSTSRGARACTSPARSARPAAARPRWPSRRSRR